MRPLRYVARLVVCAFQACDVLNDQLKPHRAKGAWAAVVADTNKAHASLQAVGWNDVRTGTEGGKFDYATQGVRSLMYHSWPTHEPLFDLSLHFKPLMDH